MHPRPLGGEGRGEGDLLSLQDKVAVVTGAGSGLGRGIALALAAKGARVAAVDIDEATAKETAALIGKASGRAIAQRADTSRAEDVDRAVTMAVKELGRWRSWSTTPASSTATST